MKVEACELSGFRDGETPTLTAVLSDGRRISKPIVEENEQWATAVLEGELPEEPLQ